MKTPAWLSLVNARAWVRARELAAYCGCRSASTHFGVARAQIEREDSRR